MPDLVEELKSIEEEVKKIREIAESEKEKHIQEGHERAMSIIDLGEKEIDEDIEEQVRGAKRKMDSQCELDIKKKMEVIHHQKDNSDAHLDSLSNKLVEEIDSYIRGDKC